MIYGSSNHPVEIKKIRLKVWTLKEEVQATFQEKVQEGMSPVEAKAYIEGVYHGLIKLPPSIEEELGPASPSENNNLDDSEDEMAKTLAEGENQETETQEAENSEESEAQAEDSEGDSVETSSTTLALKNIKVISEVETQNNLVLLKRKRPNLAEENVGNVVTILTDVNMEMISCFSSRNFLFGQTIIFEFLVPQPFFVTAEVLECRVYNMKSRIISEQRPKYRLHAKFTFPREGERTLLRRFLKSVEPVIPVEQPKAKPKVEDDDLGDLEDLGL